MRYGLTLSTAPTIEPVTLAELRKQVEVATDDHDAHLTSLGIAARQMVEAETGRQLINATWDLYLDEFPVGVSPIYLPKSPLSSVTSITYTDTDGASQTWSSSNYIVSTRREPGTVTLAYQANWPSIRYITDAIRVRFVAGYGTAATSVPAGLKAAILLLVGHWFEHREEVTQGTFNEVPRSAKALIQQYQVGDEFTEYARCQPANYATA